MPVVDLRTWLQRVDELGELRRIDGANCEEDIGMASEMLKHAEGSPVALFDNIPGYSPGYRVVVNSHGTLRRIALALGLSLDADLHELIAQWRKKVNSLTPIPPQLVDDGPIMENVQIGDEVNLLKFPTPKWHEIDGGPYIGTASCDIVRDPEEDWVNLGTYRVMLHDAKRVGFYISPGKQGRIIREKYFARNEPCPVAVAIGLPPALYMGCCTPIPWGLSEYAWAGGIAGEPMRVIRGKVTGLPIPADAEIVLEGFASPTERMVEGPFGEWTGYYASNSREEPFIDVKAVYHRNNPIISGSPPAKPPSESTRTTAFLRSATLMDDIEKAGVPDVTCAWPHPVGGSFLLAVSIKQRYPGHARQAGHVAAMCHSGAYMGRFVIVVDDDIDITDLNDLMWAVCTRADPKRSMDLIDRAWSGPLDPAIHPDEKGLNSRVIIDACRPFEWREKFPRVNEQSPEMKRKTMEKWGFLLK